MNNTARPFTIGGESLQDWKGINSSKFGYPQKVHFESKDMMKTVEGVDVPFLGRKHFTPTYSGVRKDKICLKTFPDVHNKQSGTNEPKIKTKDPFEHASRAYGHRQKRHLHQDGAQEKGYVPQVKTFYPMTYRDSELFLDRAMGRKGNIDGMEDQRNLLQLRALGDKHYKSPEYTTGFYNDGGLIPGASHKMRPKRIQVSTVILDTTKKLGTTFKDRVKREELEEEQKAVASLFEWEQTSLKDGNPKWRDPDAPEVEPPKPTNVKMDQKNAKKPTGKK
jgi:hypothetical protein